MALFIFVGSIALLVLSIWAVVSFALQKKVGMVPVLCFTGAPGTGKTKIGVSKTQKQYKKIMVLWSLGFMTKKIKQGKKKIKVKAPRPMFYSNIPIYYKNSIVARILKKVPKYEWSVILTYEHLTLQERMYEYSVVFIDELGEFADQYSYDNPFVVQYLQKFIRFIRHYLDGFVVMTDQTSSNVVVQIRRRINVIYNLSTFRRFLFYFYKTNVDEVHITEDITTIKQSNDSDQTSEYFMGHLPFKWLKKLDLSRIFTHKAYDTRCYLPLFDGIEFQDNLKTHATYMTDYLIDLPNNEQMRKQFKKDGYIDSQTMMKYVKEWQKATHKHDNKKEEPS